MSAESQLFTPVIQYLGPPGPELWCWLDDGDTLAWQDDLTTVTFSKEVRQVVSILSSTHPGLPSFTAIIVPLSIALGRVGSQDIERRMVHWLECQRIDGRHVDRVIDVLSGWPKVIEAVDQLSPNAAGVAAIISFGLRDARDWLRDTASIPSATVLEELDKDPRDRVSTRDLVDSFPRSFRLWQSMSKRAWETLLHFSRQTIDPLELSTWLRTGLIDLPAPDEPSPIDRTPITSLLRTLNEKPDSHDIVGMVASTATAVSAMVSLPRKPSQPDELPLGGFSDITNRGTPDRLLISELASPPELLMARIAQGEALYVRREIPPGPAPPIRPVLIEQSLRCWGDTRVRMTALALAYGSLEERVSTTRCQFHVVNGGNHIGENFTNREGLVRHLERLSIDRHPADGINKWLLSIQDDSESLYAEPVLIVSEETEADAHYLAFWQFQIDWHKLPSWIIAIVDHGGGVQLKRRTAKGDEFLLGLSIELKEVQSSEGKTIVKQKDALPAFLERPEAPARMGLCDQPRFCFSVGSRSRGGLDRTSQTNDAWVISHDRRLLCFQGSLHSPGVAKRLAVEVVDALPAGGIFRIDFVDNDVNLILGKPGGSEHHLIRFERGTDGKVASSITCVKLDGADVTDYAWRGGQFLRVRGKEIDSLNWVTGEVEWTTSVPHSHLGDGVFEGDRAIWIWSGNPKKPLTRLRDVGERPYRRGSESYALDQTYLLAVQNPQHEALATEGLTDRNPLAVSEADRTVINSTSRIRLLHQGLDECGDDQRDYVYSMARSRFVEEMQPYDPSRLCSNQRARLIFTSFGGTYALFECCFESGLTEHLLWSFVSRNLIPTTLNGIQQLQFVDRQAANLVSQKSLLVNFASVSLTSAGLFLRQNHTGGWQLMLGAQNNLELRRFKGKPTGKEHELNRVEFPRSKVTGCRPRWTLRRADLPLGTVFLDSRGWMHLRRHDDERELSIAMVEGPCSGWFTESGCFGSEVWSLDTLSSRSRKIPPFISEWCARWFENIDNTDHGDAP